MQQLLLQLIMDALDIKLILLLNVQLMDLNVLLWLIVPHIQNKQVVSLIVNSKLVLGMVQPKHVKQRLVQILKRLKHLNVLLL